MGLGKKLGQYNNVANTQVQQAHLPIADNGYNNNNIPSLPVAVPVTESEILYIKNLENEAVHDYTLAQATQFSQAFPINTFGLVKPFVPSGIEYPCEQVSSLIVEKMWRIVCLNELYAFYSQTELQELVNRACKHDYRTLQSNWGIPTLDMITDIASLGLYDVVVFADDSGSMSSREPSEDNMTRFDVMKNVIGTIGFWSTLLDSDGIVVRFFNSNVEGNGVGSLAETLRLFDKVQPRSSTPLGKNMKSKIFDAIIAPQVSSNELKRPILIITLTDGIPDSRQDVVNTIMEIKNFFSRTKYGSKGVAFSFAQIGTDSGATDYLDEIDKHPIIGNIVDCTSEYETERKQCGPEFTESVWVLKSMIGAIDPAYDQADEQVQYASAPPPSYQASFNDSSVPPPSYQQSMTQSQTKAQNSGFFGMFR